MSNAFSLFRALVIYGICLPLAVLIGYLLTDPMDRVNDGIVGVVLAFLTFPLFLRWHHPLLVLCWNMVAFVPFVSGYPLISLPVCLISFSISALQYTLNKKLKFISVPSLTWPLLAIAAVVLLTGQLTGGLGFRAAGGTSYGGKRYILVLIAIMGYFAMTAQRVSPQRGPLYIKLFFLSMLTAGIGHLVTLVAPSLYFIFLIFPPDANAVMSLTNDVISDVGTGVGRMGGLSTAASSGCICLLALYGIRGLFDMRSPWRAGLFLAGVVLSLLGGFRSVLILLVLTFGAQFYFEGLFRSRLLPALILCAILGAATLVPFVDKLPLSMQRTLSFLPVQIDPIAEMDAKGSTEWRVQMWKRVLPEVPGHLLGKGYSINPADQVIFQGARGVDAFEGSMVAGDYHSGPLSVIMTFGLWGTIAFLWFLYAGIKALYQNYAFGDPRFQKANTLLLSYFIAKVVFFFAIFGSFYSDLATFTGLLGLSVCINGGVRIPAPAPAVKQVFSRFKLADATR